MAVFTPLTDQQISFFIDAYDIGSFVRAEGIAEGVENTNYHVFTNEGRVILTVFEYRTNPQSLPFIFNYQEHLRAKGIECPVALKDKMGRNVGKIAGKPAALISFLQGKSVKSDQIGQWHCREVGKVLGKMHKAAEGFQGTRENPVGMETWQSLHQKIGDKADAYRPGLKNEIARELEFIAQNWPEDLPSGPVHADLFPDNVFFNIDKFELSGLIDFYFSCTAPFVYDLIITMNAWCFDPTGLLIPDKSEVFLKAYEEIRPLSEAERAAWTVLGRGASLRFFLTRLHDWVFHPPDAVVTPKDPMEYYRKLRYYRDER